jgi:uncharacterized protein (UPF0333 family)
MTDVFDRCPQCGNLVARGAACRQCASPGATNTTSPLTPNAQGPPTQTRSFRPPTAVSLAKILIYGSIAVVCIMVVIILVSGIVGSIFGGDDETDYHPSVTIGTLSTAALAAQVQADIAASFAADPQLASVRIIDNLQLVHVSGNQYQGVMRTLENGQSFTYSVDVTYDGTSFMWEIR